MNKKDILICICASIAFVGIIVGTKYVKSLKSKVNIAEMNSSIFTNFGQATLDEKPKIYEDEENFMDKLNLKIDGKNFTITLYNNETAKALKELLPMEIEMNELHGNEKYYYLNSSLPTNPEKVNQIKAGDIMLFGDDCLVIFYESFLTGYSYTKIGRVETLPGLKEALGTGNVEVKLENY